MEAQAAGTQFACFTGTKVQILTMQFASTKWKPKLLVLSLLDLLVQTYKF
jgi:hypothetical protein